MSKHAEVPIEDQVERIVLAVAREIIAEGKTPISRRVYSRTRNGPLWFNHQEVKVAIRSLQMRGEMPEKGPDA